MMSAKGHHPGSMGAAPSKAPFRTLPGEIGTVVDDKAPTSALKIRLFIAENSGLMVNYMENSLTI
ncbi:hypothetical protein [Novosphingobium sp. SG707]|uniref:hypothetical protein n=1 Tax=Novosphingobium sp. SG707 TaxID=2586996 RepID=UPI001446AD39|nr:hypothetical protein [Novosphingobium sp. SG707]